MNKRWVLARVAAVFIGAGATATPSTAQTPTEQWQLTAVIYGYLPQIGGSATFPTGTTASIGVDADQIISHLNFTVMGAFEATKGPWDLFTDILYVDVSGSKSGTRDFSVGGPFGRAEIPAGAAANLSLGVKSTLWTLAGGYRVVMSADGSLDLFAGARLIDAKQNLGWQFNTDIGPVVGPGRQGSGAVSVNNWDAIIGAKGRLGFGDRREWFVPYYVDVGTGQTQLTWQLYGGVGYAFTWGELVAVWRYIDYRFKSSDAFASLSMNGPAIGVAFHW